MTIPRHVFEQMKALIPPLNGTLHKGQSGRVGVLGGALDYTGAPYFSAISALRFGVDLSHVICSPTAAGPIKSYSPDLIVHPILREDAPSDSVVSELESLLCRLHVLVVGPGLGREDYMQNYARTAVHIARQRGMFIVLDADGLYLVGKDRSLIQGYRRAVITPNVVEFGRLAEQVGISPETPHDKKAQILSRLLGGVTVLQKGAQDVIVADTEGTEADLEASQLQGANPEKEKFSEIIKVDTPGGSKRCGGQGDVLSGSVGAFLAWGRCYEQGVFGDQSIPASRIPLLSAVGGSIVTRTASRHAFQKTGRSMVTQDMLVELGQAFADIFGRNEQSGGKL